MKQNRRNSLTACAWSTGSLFLYAGILFLMYWLSQCRLYQLSGIFLLMLATVNLILLLFCFEPKRIVPAAETTETPPPPEEMPSPEEVETQPSEKTKKSLLRKKAKKKKSAKNPDDMYNTLCRIYRPVQMFLLADVLLICLVLFGYFLASPPILETVAYWHLALIAAMFVGAIVLGKMCNHAETEDTFSAMLLRNASSFFALTRLILVFLALSLTLELLNLGNIQIYLRYGLAILFYYVGAMVIFSLTIRMIRKELGTAPGIVILLPFLQADIKELSVLSFLEKNTGITLRSLWSMKYIRKILPYAVLGGVVLFWMATGLIYVQSHQQGAVYRLGTLQEEPLAPGLHLTLPYPFDKTEIYDTETINKVTIGYKATENSDNVWTEAHGDSEYKLLLGSGNELVSINLRVEYRIKDLYKYLKSTASPEQLLQAKAYELVTDRTISADLETILATNRETFAVSLKEELVTSMDSFDSGLEVINVILESIHPPVDVAEVYQAFIGAEINAEEMILVAEAAAAVKIAEGETTYYETINEANIDYCARIALAKKEISEFIAAVEASETYPSEYAYYRYLKAIGSAYQNSKLIILGDGVDGSRLYYGNFITE